MFDGSWTVISSAYFCGSSIVDSVCLGDTRLAITFSSSPSGSFDRDGVPTTVISDVRLNRIPQVVHLLHWDYSLENK